MTERAEAMFQFLRRWLGLRLAAAAKWVYPNATMYDLCYATSPEHDPCVLERGHAGSHVPPRGRGWA